MLRDITCTTPSWTTYHGNGERITGKVTVVAMEKTIRLRQLCRAECGGVHAARRAAWVTWVLHRRRGVRRTGRQHQPAAGAVRPAAARRAGGRHDRPVLLSADVFARSCCMHQQQSTARPGQAAVQHPHLGLIQTCTPHLNHPRSLFIDQTTHKALWCQCRATATLKC